MPRPVLQQQKIFPRLGKKFQIFDSIVIGGGPGGLAAVGNLLEQRPDKKQFWVDPSFQGGRLAAKYRAVPSNTKVGLFLDYATAVEPFRQIIQSPEAQDVLTNLRNLPQDQGCQLDHAANLCTMLTEGIGRQFRNVDQYKGHATNVFFNRREKLWSLTVDWRRKYQIKAPRLVLCTGSSPISDPQTVLNDMRLSSAIVHLDDALDPAKLGPILPHDATVAVVGASHSAILVLMNLCTLAAKTHSKLRIKWFSRHKDLRYAEYKDGWILYDNTGLKGQAAQWARENLDEKTFKDSPVRKIITKIWTPPEAEQARYESELADCTHYIQAVGYEKNSLPDMHIGRSGSIQKLELKHDDTTGRFFDCTPGREPGQYIPGLFGAGIAFPERVTDPAGNVEHAVGLWKFMKFLKRVVPEWIESSNVDVAEQEIEKKV